MTRKIILCADDFGQSRAISGGIILLIQKKAISATSCMTNMPDWQTSAGRLKEFSNQVDIGLHFNLTEGAPLGKIPCFGVDDKMSSLTKLLRLAYMHRLDFDQMKDELERQIDSFVNQMGKLPDYIDGHQHIHQFPIIRDALIEVINTRFDKSKLYVRSTANLRNGPVSRMKVAIIKLTGSGALARLLESNNILHNSSFSGVYNFAVDVDYQVKFEQFVKAITDKGLIMCHPGLADMSSDDPIKHSRPLEHDFISSGAFAELLVGNNIKIARFGG